MKLQGISDHVQEKIQELVAMRREHKEACEANAVLSGKVTDWECWWERLKNQGPLSRTVLGACKVRKKAEKGNPHFLDYLPNVKLRSELNLVIRFWGITL